jgi:hypothetical protein
MRKRPNAYALLGVGLILAAGSAFGGMRVTVTPYSAASPAPLVEIVVYDGTSLPATVVAGCSEPDCMGYGGPVTGAVTHTKNYVGWSVSGEASRKPTYLYVDGKQVSSARTGKLLVWSPTTVGPHTLQGMAYNSDGVAGWSTPLTICYMSC